MAQERDLLLQLGERLGRIEERQDQLEKRLAQVPREIALQRERLQEELRRS